MKFPVVILIALSLAACTLGSEPQVIYITATPEPIVGIATPESTQLPGTVPLLPTEVAQSQSRDAAQHVVQPGDTLSSIAAAYNTSLETLLEINQIENPDVISAGQIIELPPPPDNQTPSNWLLSDTNLVRGPGSETFDVAAFIAQQPGFIRVATDKVLTNRADGLGIEAILTASEIVTRISMEFSVDPRVLLALLEYRAGWLSNPAVREDLQTNPLISEEDSGLIDRKGLYKQLAWTANELNRGYYGAKYNGWRLLEFDDGQRFLFAPGLNSATVGLQHMLHLANSYPGWLNDVSDRGFFAAYRRYFGDPLANSADTLAGITAQPELQLPFPAGEIWFFTGGAHGGWGTGSAWSAIDFAPPDDRTDSLCYTSAYNVTAVAPGLVVRSHQGTVVLDLDGDGKETTGWTILYLHLANEERVQSGTFVQAGDNIGKPSCEGGFSTATHMHIARRYNGEWLPAYCGTCAVPQFVMSGWRVISLPNQEYQGYLEKNGDRRVAEQGRLTPINRVSW